MSAAASKHNTEIMVETKLKKRRGGALGLGGANDTRIGGGHTWPPTVSHRSRHTIPWEADPPQAPKPLHVCYPKIGPARAVGLRHKKAEWRFGSARHTDYRRHGQGAGLGLHGHQEPEVGTPPPPGEQVNSI